MAGALILANVPKHIHASSLTFHEKQLMEGQAAA
jgi:hypothetical protein